MDGVGKIKRFSYAKATVLAVLLLVSFAITAYATVNPTEVELDAEYSVMLHGGVPYTVTVKGDAITIECDAVAISGAMYNFTTFDGIRLTDIKGREYRCVSNIEKVAFTLNKPMTAGLARLEIDSIRYYVGESAYLGGTMAQIDEKSDAAKSFMLPAPGESVQLDTVLTWQDMSVELKSISCEERIIDGTEFVDYVFKYTALDGWQPFFGILNTPYKARSNVVFCDGSSGGESEFRDRVLKSSMIPLRTRVEEICLVMLTSKYQLFTDVTVDIPA